MFPLKIQKLEVEAKFHKDQLDVKVTELKEEMEYKDKQWAEEIENCRKQYMEANQQKIHVTITPCLYYQS